MDRRLSLLFKFAALDKLTAPLRAMSGGAKRMGGDIAETRAELVKLQRAQSNLKGFRDQEARLKATGAKLEEVRQRLERLTDAEEGADAGSKKLARAMTAARRTANELEREYEEQGRALQQLSRKLDAAGVDVTDLGKHELMLDRRISDTTMALKAQREELARNARTQQRLSNVQQAGDAMTTGGIGLLGAGLAVGAPIAAATEKAAEYRATMTDIALKTNLSEAATVRLGKAIAEIGPRVAQLPSDLRAGVDQLAGAGLDPEQAVRIIEPIGKAATATRASIEDLSNASYAGIDNLKVPIGETARMLDVMTAAGKAGQFELKDMAQYFPALTASAAGLGQKGVPAIADLAAALQIARKGAGDAASAANNVQNLLNKINAKDSVDNFRKFGIDLPKALQKAYKEGKTPLEAIAELTKKATGGDMAKLSYLFGDAQVQAALRPLITNLDEYKQIRASAEKAVGTVDTDFARRANSGELAADQWRASFERLQVIAGTVLLPTIGKLLTRLEQWVTILSAWIDANPQTAETIMHLAAGFAALSIALGTIGSVLGPVVSGFGKFAQVMVKIGQSQTMARFLAWIGPQLQRLWPLIRTGATRLIPLLGNAFLWLGRAMMSAGAAMLANPIVLIITLIVVALAAAAYFVWKYWAQIKAWFTENWTYLRNLLLGSIVIFMPWLAAIIFVAKKIYDHWGQIKQTFMDTVNYISGIVGPVLTPLMAINNWIAGWVVKIAGYGTQIFQALLKPWLAIQSYMAGLFGRFFSFGAQIVWGLIKGIFSVQTQLIKAIADMAAKVGEKFAGMLGIKSPSRLFMAYGGHIGEGLAIGLDRGAAGPVQRMSSIAGDLQAAFAAGAAPRRGKAFAGAAARAAGGSTGIQIGTVAISIAAQPGQDPKAIATAVRAEFERLMREQAAADRSRYSDEA